MGKTVRGRCAPILVALTSLHTLKQKDYGSSWRKRGEARSILPNIDRKNDRLELLVASEDGPAIADETIFDTMADLACYSMLYMAYLEGTIVNIDGTEAADEGFERSCLTVLHCLVQQPFLDVGQCAMEWHRNYSILEQELDETSVITRLYAARDLAAAMVAYIAFERDVTPAAYAAWVEKWKPVDAATV